jgi:glycosyltransferase involved in cell wall biosynthesis
MMLNAVLCVWNEEDIIESTVKHALAQGCSNVFIIDNGSTDTTIKKAVQAGAQHVTSFLTEYFDVHKKTAHLNAVVQYFNAIFQEEHMWWMYLDADEFPNIDCAMRIIDVLKGIDSSVRGMHGYMLDHIPTHPPYTVSSYHPADFMPVCHKTNMEKTLLIRYDKGEPHLYSACGAHTLDTCGKMLPVAKNIINIHHFPMRNPVYTLKRLKKLTQRNNDGVSRVDRHDFMAKIANGNSNSQSQYRDRYDKIQSTYIKHDDTALKTGSVHYNYINIVRWYNAHAESDLAHVDACDKHIAHGLYYFFMKDYAVALRKFRAALDLCTEDTIKNGITAKIAECLSFSNMEEADTLAMPRQASAASPLQLDIQYYFGRYDAAWNKE